MKNLSHTTRDARKALEDYIRSDAFLARLVDHCRPYKAWGATRTDIIDAAAHGQEVTLMASIDPAICHPLAYGYTSAANEAQRLAANRCEFRKFHAKYRFHKPAEVNDEAGTLKTDLVDAIWRVAESLPEDLKEPFQDYHRDGLTQPVIARKRGINTSTVSRRLDRAAFLIRQRLATP